VSSARQKYGVRYNAPPKVVDFIVEQNQVDLQLYALLKARIEDAPAPG
jgi:hypothetical protein